MSTATTSPASSQSMIASALHKTLRVLKRDGTVGEFDERRIENAISSAFRDVHDLQDELLPPEMQRDIGSVVHTVLALVIKKARQGVMLEVEIIQDLVEDALMSEGFHEVAKSYILYREKRAQERKRDLFKKRIYLKPYEYPELLEYTDAIRHSYWIHTEFNYTSDIQDFKIGLNEAEKSAITNTMLAISQIEVAVKTFWGNLYDKMPKPEIGAVGATFAESEVRHHDAYSHLLDILGLNDQFVALRDNPVVMERVHYLEKALANAKSEDNRDYAESVLLFSLFIEHVSLFSQFLIIMAFNKHRDKLKGMSNVVEATSKEEQIHGNFGIDLIRIIMEEQPDWFDEERMQHVQELCKQAYEAEEKVIDWIFEAGELEFLPAKIVKEFVKNRFNNSLKSIGAEPVFETDEELVRQTDWFDDEIIGTKHGDFFVKRSINYNKRSKSITSADLF